MINKHFVLLKEVDNVFVCCKPILLGNVITLADIEVVMTADITVGHKIARKAIVKGERIIKYGVSIGYAIADIVFGEHIHMHNMKSDYITSHTRQTRT